MAEKETENRGDLGSGLGPFEMVDLTSSMSYPDNLTFPDPLEASRDTLHLGEEESKSSEGDDMSDRSRSPELIDGLYADKEEFLSLPRESFLRVLDHVPGTESVVEGDLAVTESKDNYSCREWIATATSLLTMFYTWIYCKGRTGLRDLAGAMPLDSKAMREMIASGYTRSCNASCAAFRNAKALARGEASDNLLQAMTSSSERLRGKASARSKGTLSAARKALGTTKGKASGLCTKGVQGLRLYAKGASQWYQRQPLLVQILVVLVLTHMSTRGLSLGWAALQPKAATTAGVFITEEEWQKYQELKAIQEGCSLGSDPKSFASHMLDVLRQGKASIKASAHDFLETAGATKEWVFKAKSLNAVDLERLNGRWSAMVAHLRQHKGHLVEQLRGGKALVADWRSNKRIVVSWLEQNKAIMVQSLRGTKHKLLTAMDIERKSLIDARERIRRDTGDIYRTAAIVMGNLQSTWREIRQENTSG